MEEGKKQAYNRTKNRRLVLDYLRLNHSASATKLSDSLHLSNAAMSSILKELLQKNQITEASKKSESGKGRKQVYYSLNKNFGLIAIFHLDSNCFHLYLANSKEELLESEMYEVDEKNINASTIAYMKEKLKELLEQPKYRSIPLLRILFSSPSLVDCRNREIHSPLLTDPYFQGNQWLIGFEDDFPGAKVLVSNSIHLAMEAEIHYGNRSRNGSAILVSNNHRIGGAIAINKEVLLGENGYMGDFAALQAIFRGKLRRLSEFASVESIMNHFGKKDFSSLLYDYQNDIQVKAYILETVHSAARALFVVSRLLNISTFIFTGSIVALGEGVIDAVESEFNKDPVIKVKTTISSIGKQGIILGAIHHAMDDVLNEEEN